MLSLVGGELYQWDTGRVVKVVPDESVTVHEVHFSTKRMDYAYVLKTYIEDGVTYCAIPNLILQQSNRLLCYEVCQNSDGEETIADTYFDIIKRNRPEDYVYTEQEHFTFVKLENRLDKVEESSHTHDNKTELDTITEGDLETWRNPNSSAVTGGAQVGILFKDFEVTTTLAEDASEWTSPSSKAFECTFRPSPGQVVFASVKGVECDSTTFVNLDPEGISSTRTIVGNYSIVNSKLRTWFNFGDSLPNTPNCETCDWCFVFDQPDAEFGDDGKLKKRIPTCTLYTKEPGTYKVTVTIVDYSIDPLHIKKMYNIQPYVVAEYGTYTNWKDLTETGKYDLWEVSIKKTDYYNGVVLKEINGTKYVYLYDTKYDYSSETGVKTEYTLTYDTATETVTCSDSSLNPETDVIISVHHEAIHTIPDKCTPLGEATPDKVGKMLTAVDVGGTYNKWQNSKYQYQWVDAPKTKTFYADFDVNDGKNITTKVTPDEIVEAYESGQNVIARIVSHLYAAGHVTLVRPFIIERNREICFSDVVVFGGVTSGKMVQLYYDYDSKKWYFDISDWLLDKEHADGKYIDAYLGEDVAGKFLGIDKSGVVQPMNLPSSSSNNAVLYTEQTLTDDQKKQARNNIGAISKLEPLTVTFTQDEDGSWSADKTFAEVKAAIEAGRFVQGMCDDGPLSVYMCTEEMIGFSYSVCLPEAGLTLLASMTSNGSVFCDTMQNNYFDGNNAVLYTEQTLTDDQKKQARNNIGAISKLEPLTVTFTQDEDGSWSADKTFAEVKAAIEAGRFVQGMCDDGPLSVYMCTEEMIGFSYSVCLPEAGLTLLASMTSNGSVFCDTMQNNYFDGNNVEPKTDAMTQPVGVDYDGKLWTEIPVDGTTIKLNDQGQLTLALSNANGVSF